MTIYPKVTGSISDKDVQDNPDKYNGATAATEEMLTPDMLTWSLGASIGQKFSRNFAMNKQAQKVKFVATDVTADPTDGDDGENTNQGGQQTGGEIEGG